MYIRDTVNYLFHSAGCSPPTPPVNGSVSGFTSSRVGAQVTYHCDTDLVLVVERVATCSQSLQWLPSSENVMCVQHSGSYVLDFAKLLKPVETQISYNITLSSSNNSCTFSCDPNYSLHGSTTSQCVSGEWTASPDTVIYQLD